MPPERRPPDDPLEWLNRAKSNLQRAKTLIPGAYLEDLCFDAQQSAEKAVKAVLAWKGVPFPLRNYRNQFAHQYLQRGLAMTYLRELLSHWR